MYNCYVTARHNGAQDGPLEKARLSAKKRSVRLKPYPDLDGAALPLFTHLYSSMTRGLFFCAASLPTDLTGMVATPRQPYSTPYPTRSEY